MKNWTVIRERYLRDALPIRLGGLAANLARIKSLQRMKVGEQSRLWSERVLEMSGLLR